MSENKAKLAIALMIHDSFEAARSLVRYFLEYGIFVVIHVDKKSSKLLSLLETEFSDSSHCIVFSSFDCRWGEWSLVEAELACYRQIIDNYNSVEYVSFLSGADLPIKPLPELQRFLAGNSNDFVECIDITRYKFVVSGPQIERFTLWWFFNYLENGFLFNLFYKFQRRLKIRRAIPLEMTPCMGGQFKTMQIKTIKSVLELLLENPSISNYFKYTWIPDESFFPTVVNYLYETTEQNGVLMNSTTFRIFNNYGRPKVFYEDNLASLNTRDFWFARKFDVSMVEDTRTTCNKIFELGELVASKKRTPAEIDGKPDTWYIIVEPTDVSQELMASINVLAKEKANFMGGIDTDRFNQLAKDSMKKRDRPIYDQWQYFKKITPEQYLGNLRKSNTENLVITIDLKSIHLHKYQFLRNNPYNLFIFPKDCMSQKYSNAKAWLENNNTSVYTL